MVFAGHTGDPYQAPSATRTHATSSPGVVARMRSAGMLADLPADNPRLAEPGAAVSASLRIAFVGTYPPRRCGIATFTQDLAQAVGSAGEQLLPTLALTDPGGRYEYPPDVGYEIR